MSPLQRNITIENVGNTAAFLCSDLAAGITGEILYVDGGYHNLGMTFEVDRGHPEKDFINQILDHLFYTQLSIK